MPLVRAGRTQRVRLSVDHRVLVLHDPEVTPWSRTLLVRERLAPELAARRLALVVVPGPAIAVDVEVAPSAPADARAARFGVAVAGQRMRLATSAGDGEWIALAPGRWIADFAADGPGRCRLRLAPAATWPPVPRGVPDLGARGFDHQVVRPQEMESLLDGAARAAAASQRALHERLGPHDRFALDQGSGRLTLFCDGNPTRAVPFHAIGTLGDRGGFRWAWANPSLAEPLRRRAERVRGVGVARDLAWLTEPELALPADDVFRLVAVATRSMDLDGWYPVPYDRGILYVALEAPPPPD